MAEILVCDDDKDIVEAIEIYLTQEGYHILKAYDGEQAIRVLQNNPVDLLILMLGTNDCKTRYNASAAIIAKGLEQTIIKARKNASQDFELLIISPIHLGKGVGEEGFDPEFDERSELVSKHLAAEYKKIALQHQATFLDASTVAVPSETDREHLDESGHAALAEAIYQTIHENHLLDKKEALSAIA